MFTIWYKYYKYGPKCLVLGLTQTVVLKWIQSGCMRLRFLDPRRRSKSTAPTEALSVKPWSEGWSKSDQKTSQVEFPLKQTMSTMSTVSISEETVRATLLGSEGNHKNSVQWWKNPEACRHKSSATDFHKGPRLGHSRLDHLLTQGLQGPKRSWGAWGDGRHHWTPQTGHGSRST